MKLDFKNSLCIGCRWILAMLEGKIRMTPFFKVQFSKITVCRIWIWVLECFKYFWIQRTHLWFKQRKLAPSKWMFWILPIMWWILLLWLDYLLWWHWLSKGQLISKVNFKVFIWTIKRTKIFLHFCPSLKKKVRSRKIRALYTTN